MALEKFKPRTNVVEVIALAYTKGEEANSDYEDHFIGEGFRAFAANPVHATSVVV